MTIACRTKVINGKLSFETIPVTFTNLDPNAKPVIEPTPQSITNDQVYKADGSPDFATFHFNKKIITYALIEPKDGILVDIPHGHNVTIAVNITFEMFHLFTDPNKIQFIRVAYSPTALIDITIKLDPNDPEFLADKQVMAYCHYPETTPVGAFTCVINSAYLFSLDGKYNFANNLNQTLRHELGHGIGCVHTTDPNDIMYPFYHNSVIPTKTDIFQYQNMYGMRNIPDWIIKQFFIMDSKLLEFKL
jgi:hypothetical protein